MDFTSSISGEYFPFNNAWHFAPITKNWEALGPAPQEIYFLTDSVANGSLGLVFEESFTAYSTTFGAIGVFLTKFWKKSISSAVIIFWTLWVIDPVVSLIIANSCSFHLLMLFHMMNMEGPFLRQ